MDSSEEHGGRELAAQAVLLRRRRSVRGERQDARAVARQESPAGTAEQGRLQLLSKQVRPRAAPAPRAAPHRVH